MTGMGAAPLAGYRILVVEDEYLLARQVQRALVQEGATVAGPAPGVTQALALIGEDPRARIDAAILDVNLVGERVYPVATALLDHGIPFVFTSGLDAAEADPRFAAILYLVKPVTMTQLVRTIAALLTAPPS